MLTSLSINGDIDDATIIVAGFGLTAEDRAVLRAGARQMSDRLRFIEISRDALRRVDRGGYTESYPLSVLGRLFIADTIDLPGALLLTIDSDMIVNVSLRPLFERDLNGDFFAAIHDPPRRHDPNYFNSGLTLLKVEDYKRHNIAERSLLWLAEQGEHPRFPDQDALNHVVGDCWHRLDRSWNFFFFEDERFTTEGYEGAKIAHFAGPKPWDYADHPGAPLYNRYLTKLRARYEENIATGNAAGREFLATCYEVFLGRSLESDGVVHNRARWPKSAIVLSVVKSSEFADNISIPLSKGEAFASHIFASSPSIRQKFWVIDELGLRPETCHAIEGAESWSDILTLILGDDHFRQANDLPAD